jgi:methyl-accepting chemotaxis protein
MEGRKGWKLRHWIILGYSVPIVALIVSASVTIINVRQLKVLDDILDRTWQNQNRINSLSIDLHDMSREIRAYLLDGEAASNDALTRARGSALATVDELNESLTVPEVIEVFEEVQVNLDKFIEVNDTLSGMVSSGRRAEAVELWKIDDARTVSNDLKDALTQIVELQNEVVRESQDHQSDALQRLQVTLIIAVISSLALSAMIGTWIITKTARMMNEAAGDIASSASEIAASVEQQERTSSQQAASVSETSTTMDELGASSRQSSEQAEAAAAGAQQALKLAEGGTRAVERSLDGMNALREKVEAIADQILRLSEQTSQIGGISGLVSDLANQTNMLALNAAVEAVRAGEHGKGFAVVSGEIRKLADQSKKSAEKINALVADIQTAINSTVMVTDEGTKTVEEGVKIAEETSDAFAGVADAVNNVVLNSQQISLNVKQQAVAIQQVVSAMNSLNTGAQETANGVSQIKIGTHQLNESAMLLKNAI